MGEVGHLVWRQLSGCRKFSVDNRFAKKRI